MTEAFASISKLPSRGKAARSSPLERAGVRWAYDHEDVCLHQKTIPWWLGTPNLFLRTQPRWWWWSVWAWAKRNHSHCKTTFPTVAMGVNTKIIHPMCHPCSHAISVTPKKEPLLVPGAPQNWTRLWRKAAGSLKSLRFLILLPRTAWGFFQIKSLPPPVVGKLSQFSGSAPKDLCSNNTSIACLTTPYARLQLGRAPRTPIGLNSWTSLPETPITSSACGFRSPM